MERVAARELDIESSGCISAVFENHADRDFSSFSGKRVRVRGEIIKYEEEFYDEGIDNGCEWSVILKAQSISLVR